MVCSKAGDEFDPVGVTAAESEVSWGAALFLLSRREVTASASGGRVARLPGCGKGCWIDAEVPFGGGDGGGD